jgi:hypothetical protein
MHGMPPPDHPRLVIESDEELGLVLHLHLFAAGPALVAEVAAALERAADGQTGALTAFVASRLPAWEEARAAQYLPLDRALVDEVAPWLEDALPLLDQARALAGRPVPRRLVAILDNRSRRLRRLGELGAPEVLLGVERRSAREVLAGLVATPFTPARRPLDSDLPGLVRAALALCGEPEERSFGLGGFEELWPLSPALPSSRLIPLAAFAGAGGAQRLQAFTAGPETMPPRLIQAGGLAELADRVEAELPAEIEPFDLEEAAWSRLELAAEPLAAEDARDLAEKWALLYRYRRERFLTRARGLAGEGGCAIAVSVCAGPPPAGVIADGCSPSPRLVHPRRARAAARGRSRR